MSDEQLRGESFDRRERTEFAGLDAEQAEAARLSEILGATDRGEVPDLDPNEDPMLSSLSETATTLRASLEAASSRASFETFHRRSRRRILATIPERVEVIESDRSESLLQRWNGLFTSVSSAAAAAVATFVVTVLAIGGGASTEPLATVQVTDAGPDAAPSADAATDSLPTDVEINLTALSVDEQIVRYRGLLAELNDLTDGGHPADAGLLREIADTSATVARAIEEQPGSVGGPSAWNAYHTTFTAQQALSRASVASDDDQVALDTAQVVADGAFVTAARYLGTSAPSYDEVVATIAPNEPIAETP